MEFKLLETKELKIHTCSLPFSYMGQTGLFLYAGYRWNCQENWQEGCTCWEYKHLVKPSPACTKHALISRILSVILANTNPQSLKGMHLLKEDDACVLAYTETITERHAYHIPVAFDLVAKFVPYIYWSRLLCLWQSPLCGNTISKGLLIGILWQYMCAIWKHGVCWTSFWSGIRCKGRKIYHDISGVAKFWSVPLLLCQRQITWCCRVVVSGGL
jgi:hypothetical protein